MKKIRYSIAAIITIAAIVTACSSSDDDDTMRWRENTTDFAMYAGSVGGGEPIDYDTIPGLNSDSLTSAMMSKYIGGIYNPNLFSIMSVDFVDDRLVFIDSMAYRKIVGSYEFNHDSLYVKKTDGSRRFIAEGNRTELFRRKGFARYKNTAGNDTVVMRDYHITPDNIKTEAGIPLTQPTDTVMWLNVKYLFD